MKTIVETSAKTVEEAVSLALQELLTTRDKVDVEVLEEGSKGIFGIIGGKNAKVRVTVKLGPSERAESFVNEVIAKMKISVDTQVSDADGNININLTGKEVGVLIGRRGETLDAMQYLTSLVANRGEEKYKKVVIDTENYRVKREDTLKSLANRLADKVIKTRKTVTLEPMNPYERRLIHATLQTNKQVETYSIGEEPYRKIVIKLKQDRDRSKDKNTMQREKPNQSRDRGPKNFNQKKSGDFLSNKPYKPRERSGSILSEDFNRVEE